MKTQDQYGLQMHTFAKQLWPINRSLTGDGVRETLAKIQQHLPDTEILEVPSGTEAFDWTVPKEWKVNAAWIVAPNGEKVCDFSKNNLHLVGYSVPVKKKLSLEELQDHLFSLPDQPKAIPYITSYYKEFWGFCLTHEQRLQLQEGEYEVHIDSVLFDGSLTYGELVIPGETEDEILISTYICHPSMGNNEVSGPCVSTFIGKWLSSRARRRYTYRLVFVPETIGSIVYLARNLDHLKTHTKAGFNVTCVGDDRSYSYLPSRNGDTLSDRVAKHVLSHIDRDYQKYSWRDRGSDERQYCAPHIDLPIASIMRTKYGEYEEYHTSLDDLVNVVTPEGLEGGYKALKTALEIIERNSYPCVTVMGEPQLGKRGMYPNISTKQSNDELRLMMDVISWADGSKSTLEIANLTETPFDRIYAILERLSENELIRFLQEPAQ